MVCLAKITIYFSILMTSICHASTWEIEAKELLQVKGFLYTSYWLGGAWLCEIVRKNNELEK